MNTDGGNSGSTDERLPLRWVVILAVASGIGIAVGWEAGLPYGVGTAIAVAGLLHTIVRR